MRRVFFGKVVPVLHTRLVIESPRSRPLQYVTRLLPAVEPNRDESAGIIRLVFESGLLEPIKEIEPFMPSDVPRWPYVAFSTGTSWKAVAARYSQMVDEQIHPAESEDIVQETLSGHKTREEMAASLVAQLHRDVRYTGVEFGQASLVPGKPTETLKRKYGDCKDKAALLVAMLRAVGIPAYIALLSASPGHEVDRELPGVGAFDHAIVYVPGRPEFWMDPTDRFARLGDLPSEDQGRLALVAGPNTTDLTRTPEASSNDNRVVETREFLMAELGPAHVIETTETWGSIERRYRNSYGNADSNELRKELENYVKFSVPFRLRLEAVQATRGFATQTEAVVAIPVAMLTSGLPSTFLWEDTEDSAESQGDTEGSSSPGKSAHRRTADLVLPEPFVTEWRYRIVPPPGFRPRPLPEAGEEHLGPGCAPQGVCDSSRWCCNRKLAFRHRQAEAEPGRE